MSFLLSHSTLEFDTFTILMLLLCIAVGVYWYFGMRKLNKEKKKLEEAAAAEFNAQAVKQAPTAESGETKS